MEIFTASLPKEVSSHMVQAPKVLDVHGETRVSGYCEFCWSYDLLENLVVLHEQELFRHLLAHSECANPLSGWEYCTC